MDHPRQIFLKSIADHAPESLIDLFDRTSKLRNIRQIKNAVTEWCEHWSLSANWILDFALIVVFNMERAALQLSEKKNVNVKEFSQKTWTDALDQMGARIRAIEKAIVETGYKPKQKDYHQEELEKDCRGLVLYLCHRMNDSEIVERMLNQKIPAPAALREEVNLLRQARKRISKLLDLKLPKNRKTGGTKPA